MNAGRSPQKIITMMVSGGLILCLIGLAIMFAAGTSFLVVMFGATLALIGAIAGCVGVLGMIVLAVAQAISARVTTRVRVDSYGGPPLHNGNLL